MNAIQEPTAHVTTGQVAAAFVDRAHAEEAILALEAASFPREAIGAAIRNHNEEKLLIEHTGAHGTGEERTSIVEGGLIGGFVGAIIGFGILSVPGVGPVIAGGVLASALAGAGIGAASGGIHAALTHLGLSVEQADELETHFRAGAALVIVNAGARADEAMRIFDKFGGVTHASPVEEALTEEEAEEIEEKAW
ncbi:hypothetical protein CCAX7_15690 [Capsulimonas corticalis]|uniref:Uncharacterized protein n=1 Tax=Capsulimonas corticalis TaxID=2219043 RepID=A0A402CZ72_9BACT|nr:hypothetical protein [Capsulimonas corticalis]BDI29518.1 hypothetical protein CCAX7_15690 [Capsulimonas corticalis]